MGTPDIRQLSDQIFIQNDEIEANFTLYTGDARLKGESDTVWLKAEDHQGIRYLRKLPLQEGNPGIALFDSINDLQRTIDSGDFYIA